MVGRVTLSILRIDSRNISKRFQAESEMIILIIQLVFLMHPWRPTVITPQAHLLEVDMHICLFSTVQ
jgi:hypothetical protein